MTQRFIRRYAAFVAREVGRFRGRPYDPRYPRQLLRPQAIRSPYTRAQLRGAP